MNPGNSVTSAKDKVLFTPGPLTTSRTVKQAMLRDLGSRDTEFIGIIADVRRRLLELASAKPDIYTAVLMQGSGTFGVESVLSSTIPPQGRLLVIVNGAYGRRMVKMAAMMNISCHELTYPEDRYPLACDVDEVLAEGSFTDVAIVHCETTTGIINPLTEIGAVVKRHGCHYIVDAMSSFGAYPIDMDACNIDYLVSSANKCIEGVPGFSFVLARRKPLAAAAGWARSLSLDLLAQFEGLEANGQFRFTPPTHAILAFHQALLELEAEGGVTSRAARYQDSHTLVVAGMRDMGFKEYLQPEDQGYIITSFYCPKHPKFVFTTFYERLSAQGYVIYPGKVSQADCFRIGHVGRIDANDARALLAAIRDTLAEMAIPLPVAC